MTIPFQDFVADVSTRKGKYMTAIERVLDSGYYILGPEVQNFEGDFADYLSVPHVIGVANGLEALEIALMALEIGEGDEVITTPISAVATTLAILAVGATPIFADVDKSGLLSAESVQEKITSKTKAVIPVHLYGAPVNLTEFVTLCQEANIALIEDAAQAQGSLYNGQHVGTFGEIGCFSFYPTKNLGAFGDAGAVVTRDKKIAEICESIRNYGQEQKYVHTRYGLNSRLDEIHAAVLQVKLGYLDEDNMKRREIFKQYQKGLSKVNEVDLIMPADNTQSNHHLCVIRAQKRDLLKSYLHDKGITALVHYPVTIPDQPMFDSTYADLDIPVARKFVQEILSLPAYPHMSNDQVTTVIEGIASFYET